MKLSASRRYREVLKVFSRHGLSQVLEGAGLRKARNRATTGVHLRQAFEELGTTFIKFGQILSTRHDLLPEKITAELEKLQTGVSPLPFDSVRGVLEEELEEISRHFRHIEEKPLASASIGQVHKAVTIEGTETVVKVRRPGITEQVELDLKILSRLSHRLVHFPGIEETRQIEDLYYEFAGTMRAELDFLREAENISQISRNFEDWPDVIIPFTDPERTTSRVLTMEYMEGLRFGEFREKHEEDPGFQKTRKEIAELSAEVLFKMIFEDGFFHADVHQGNFLLNENHELIVLDFGMVGSIDQQTRQKLMNIALAFSSNDAELLTDALLDITIEPVQGTDIDALISDIKRLLYRTSGRVLEDISLGEVLGKIFTLLRRYHLRLPPTSALLFKTLIMAEGTARAIDPGFELHNTIEKQGKRWMKERYRPDYVSRDMWRYAKLWKDIGTETPLMIKRMMRKGMNVGVEPKGWENIVAHFHMMVNRIAVTLLLASFIIALSLLLSVFRPDEGYQLLSWFLWGLFFLSIVLGASLIISILSSRHKFKHKKR
ncbi:MULTISPECIES: ABC1 kinase family protein [Salimicrobium]|uniref:2-octaprenylphenol hydroxylase n=2 Tax=Salimicrobium TaxID=351195 RepID=A0ABY1KVS0_9BACI|nr:MULTISPECIES: AarF/UbiB family protein [Salimicrobium]SDY22401.1 ubiquinone biosynthesis protein [Salimicrobium album]SIS84498.1 2-octaprenylphenol hydroxylase [Salimicrobium salexigens]